MKNIIIEGKSGSPSLHINEADGFIEIKGTSAIKNPIDFYLNLVKWVYIFNPDSNEIKKFNVRLDTMDNSSARWLFLIIKQMEKIDNASTRIIINWYYKLKNSRMYSFGNKYQSTVRLPFNLITT